MAIFHVEVHSKDRQIEHYVCLDCKDMTEALQRVRDYYTERGQIVGLWENEVHRNDANIQYLVFDISELEPAPVIYIAGEYRSQFPI